MKTLVKTYKILILSDLKKSSNHLLKSAVSLAKIINANIELFHVKNASDIVERENQLSAMRSINKEYVKTEQKIKKLIAPFSAEYDVPIDHAFAFGNPKKEISKRIQELQPDVVVIGKRSPKTLSLMGDQMTQYVLKQYNGTVLIASNHTPLEPNEQISLGLLNETNDHLNVDFAEDIIEHSQQPLKSFKIVNSSKTQENSSIPSHEQKIDYVFEQSDSVLKNLSRYLSKNNVNLLCVNREDNDAISKLKVSLLVAK
jgi:nucleotide-binding universal stress UspA family protein